MHQEERAFFNPGALSILIILFLTCLGYGCAHKPLLSPDKMTTPSGFDLYEPYRAFLIRQDRAVVQSFVFRAATEEKIVALTFDDGPTSHAPRITATLEKHACPATFFLIAGRVNETNLKTYNHVLFEAGIHGYEHRKFTLYDRETSYGQIHLSRQAMHRLGLFPRYFRPPYGVINDDLRDALQAEGLAGILWSLDSQDWHGLAGRDLVEQVTSGLTPGAVILLHECHATAMALPEIIEGIRERGFVIVPLESLLYYPRYPYDSKPMIVQARGQIRSR